MRLAEWDVSSQEEQSKEERSVRYLLVSTDNDVAAAGKPRFGQLVVMWSWSGSLCAAVQ